MVSKQTVFVWYVKFPPWLKAMGSKRQWPAKEVQLADPSTFVILKEVLLELFQSVFLQLQFSQYSEIPAHLTERIFLTMSFLETLLGLISQKNPMSLFPLAIMVCISCLLYTSRCV